MTDILERLLDPQNNDPSDRFDAADEIERLRKECAQLERALLTEKREVMRLSQSLSDRDPGTKIKPKSIMGNFDE